VRSLGVVVARAASKRLPLKNLKPLLGHPLVAWSLRAALASRLDRVILSTEDDRIAEIGRRYGAEIRYRRPLPLAADFAGSEEIAEHALDWAEQDEGRRYDVVTILQPTTPFVEPETINACLDEVQKEGCMATITGRHSAEPPAWLFRIDERGFASPWLEGEVRGEREHSQFLEKLLIPTGAVYANRVEAIRKQRTHIGRPLRFVLMDRARAVDIDDEFDFVMAEALGRYYGFTLTPGASEAS
jgi:CMP-N,N'-diacetyllegionaminic acid synthase